MNADRRFVRALRCIPACFIFVASLAISCTGPGPRLSVGDPVEERRLADGTVQRWYAVASADRPRVHRQIDLRQELMQLGVCVPGENKSARR